MSQTQVAGWMLSGYATWVALWLWSGVVLVHVLVRLARNLETDAIRASGPVD